MWDTVANRTQRHDSDFVWNMAGALRIICHGCGASPWGIKSIESTVFVVVGGKMACGEDYRILTSCGVYSISYHISGICSC